MRKLILSGLIIFAATMAQAAAFQLSDTDITTEGQFLTSIGVNLKNNSFLLKDPFATPFVSPRTFLLPHHWYSAKSPDSVRADEFLADLDALETILRYQYSGWEVAEKRGWNWQNWFAEWRKVLAARGTAMISTDDAFAPIQDLHTFMPDNHTGPLINRRDFQSGGVTALLESPPLTTCTHVGNKNGKQFEFNPKDPSQFPQKVLYPDANGRLYARHLLTYTSAKGELTTLYCGPQTIRLIPDYDPTGKERMKAVLALAQTPKDAPSYRRVSPEVGYLRMPTMTATHEVEYRKLESDIGRLSDGREKVLIVDARQNGGGSLFLKTLMRWFDPKTMMQNASRIIYRQTNKQSCFANTLGWGYLAGSGTMDHPELVKDFAEFAQTLVDAPDALCKTEFATKEVPKGQRLVLVNRRFDAKAPRQTPIVLLVIDHGCGSNCEALTGVLASYPQTLIAGVNTFGVGEFGGVGDVMLPRTRTRFRIATNYNEIYEDGRSFEGYGIKPDVLLNTETLNSPEFLIRFAEALAKL